MKKQHQAFAVVGMDCRFPGADNYHQFWENLENNISSISEVPKDRWCWEDYYGDPETTANRTKVKWGGFISNMDKFDPMFFGISPKEAACIDPQHRLFLMSSWKCLEDAGYNVEDLSGREIGVYAGVSKNDYAELMRELKQDIAPFVSTGTVHSILSNRVSFLFDFHGRSESVDTACSSGLVALHNAMRDIANGECEAAIVGGVNALLAPTMYLSHSKSGMLSADGQCKTFDEGANGYVRAEGVGTLFIKSLERALDDGDNIHAVIKGSAINHGGRANFLTSPTVRAQSEVIQKAFNNAQVTPNSITYVEAHGTGTPMGDPIEISALKDAYQKLGGGISRNAYCALSAVKTNVGHLESASGIAGIIKTILSLQHKKIPALQNFNRLNPYLDLNDSPFYMANKNIAWNRIEDINGKEIPRRASVSSFGMGGVNGHVILEEAPTQPDQDSTEQQTKFPVLIPFSSKNKALSPYLAEVCEFLLRHKKNLSPTEERVFLGRLAYTLSCGRSQMTTRLAFVVSSLDELTKNIHRFLEQGADTSRYAYGHVKIKRGEKPQVLRVDSGANLFELAAAWVKGSKLDWSQYYSSVNHPRRLPLPTYFFAQKRCWFGDDIVRPKELMRSDADMSSIPAANHGLVNMNEALFSKKLSGGEFYLRDHVVQGTKFLPGVAYLELVRAASESAGVYRGIISIQDVYWLKPVAVNDIPIDLEIRLNNAGDTKGPIEKEKEKEKRKEIAYEIHVEKNLHAKGRLVFGGEGDVFADEGLDGFLTHNRLDVNALKQSFDNEKHGVAVDASTLYQTFKKFGLSYGESFRPIESSWVSDSEVLTKLVAPECTRAGFCDFVLHPTMMDGVFQSIVLLTLLGQKQTGYQYVPFSLERIDILGKIGATQWVYAKASSKNQESSASLATNELRYDAVMMDEQGKVVIKLYGLQKRAIGSAIRPEIGVGVEDTENSITPLTSRPKPIDALTDSVAPSFCTIPPAITRASAADIYYRSTFVSVPVLSSIPESDDSSRSTVSAILVLSNTKSIREKVALNIAENVPIFVVSTGERYQRIDDFNVVLSPVNQEDIVRLVAHIKSLKITISHVLHMWNMNDEDHHISNTEVNVKDFGIYAILSLTQTLMKQRAYKKIKMMYCYRDDEPELRPCHAMVAGFARTLIYENPNIDIQTLGLSIPDDDRVNGKREPVTIAMAELLRHSDAKLHEIRVSGNVREIRQVIAFDDAMEIGVSEKSVFRKGGTYILSGGAGGLGVIFSSYLAKHYNANIILLGRSVLNQHIQSICESIVNLGGQCNYYSVNISDGQAMASVMAKIRGSHSDINGVIHAAGVIEDAYIIRKSRVSFQKVIETKTLGVRHLDTLTKNDNLDFFMMFSSIAALMPNQGQADYAAANSYLDYFSSYRNQLVHKGQRNGVSVAINWPLWANGGMGVTAEEEAHLLKVFGMKPLDTSLGIEVFESTLKFANKYNQSKRLDQVFVIDGDKGKISACLGMTGMSMPVSTNENSISEAHESHLAVQTLADVVAPKVTFPKVEAPKTLVPKTEVPKTEVSKKGERIMASQYNTEVEASIDGKGYVLALFSKHFDIAQASIDTSANFSEFGVDSMVMITIAKEINAYFGLDIKPIVFFEVNTIEKFIKYLEPCIRKEKMIGAVPTDGTPGEGRSFGSHASVPLHNRSLIDPSISIPSEMTFKRRFNVDEFYLKDHVVEDQYNMPGACYIEMARQCGDQLFGDGAVKVLTNNYWVSQLSSPDSDFDAYVHVIKKSGAYEYEVASYGEYPKIETKQLHAIGQFHLDYGSEDQDGVAKFIDLDALRKRCMARQTPDLVYPQIIAEGLHVGPTFMPMSEILLGQGEALAHLALPRDISHTDGDYILHPTMLTGVFQTALISNRYDKQNTSRQYIPISIDEISVYRPVRGNCFVVSKASDRNPKNKQLKKFDLCICADNGEVLVKLNGFSIRALKEAAQISEHNTGKALGGNTSSIDQSERLRLTESFIKGLLAGPVGLPADEIESEQEFDAYGINSVMIVELNTLFESTFGALSKTLFFEYANVAELAEYFLENHHEPMGNILGVGSEAHKAGLTSTVESNVASSEAEKTEPTLSETPLVNLNTSIESAPNNRDIQVSLQRELKELLSEPLGLPVEDIDVDESFESYGINSVMIVELNKRFESKFGPLSKTLFFEYDNIEDLSEYFIENHHEVLLTLLDVDIPVLAPATVNSDALSSQRHDQTPSQHTNSQNSNGLPESSIVSNNAGDTNEARQSDDQHKENTPQDIAIIGVAGRYPEAANITQFWELLKAGRDCIKSVPKGHFDGESVFDANPERDKIYSKLGGFVDDVDKFDAAFFNISPREAELIDPQERLFLEVTWSALEDAGYTPDSLREMSDSEVGVFVGALWQPYQSIGTEETMRGNPVAPSGLLYSIANRISYYLNLSGPSLAIDTACSASLTAVHMACQSIRTGDCKVAIAGGVNLSLHSSKYLFLSQNRFLSTDGRCRSFGEGGDGYVPGEGVGSILLKPLDEAIKDKDQIYAVIKGSAVNHGGKTHGYSVPNPNAQASLIQKTLERSKINPRSIGYIEAHGTGTPLGDPIEITGLKKAFQENTDDKQFCAIGSVKSNIGHLEAAAGIAAITKTVLQMKHNTLVPSIHADELNKNINFEDSPFQVQRSLGAWRKSDIDQSRRAGISSFGAGGANAHLILEQYNPENDIGHGPSVGDNVNNLKFSAPSIAVLSAKDSDRLLESANNLKTFLEQRHESGDAVSFESLLFTLQVGRQAMSSRLAIAADSVADLCVKLSKFIDGDANIDGVYSGDVDTKSSLAIFSNDEDIGVAIDAWVAKSKTKKVAQLWATGFSIDWRKHYLARYPVKISLPTYPFEKSRYWLPEGGVDGSAVPIRGDRLHPLVHKNTSTLNQQQFSSYFDGREFFLDDHRVGVDRILPAVAYIEMFRAAAALSHDSSAVYRLSHLAWSKPIMVGDMALGSEPVNVEVVLTPDNDTISIRAQVVEDVRGKVEGETEEKAEAIVHCEGTVSYVAQHREESEGHIDVDAVLQSMHSKLDGQEIYRILHGKGLNLRAAFQGLEWLKWNEGQAIGKISLPKNVLSDSRSRYSVHPCLLDSALQVALTVLETQHDQVDSLYLPLSIEAVTFYDHLPNDIYSLVTPSDDRSMEDSHATVRSFDVSVCDEHGRIVLQVKNIAFKESNMASGSIQSQYDKGAERVLPSVTYSSFDWIKSDLLPSKDEYGAGENKGNIDAISSTNSDGISSDMPDVSGIFKAKQKSDRVIIVSNSETLLDTFSFSLSDDTNYDVCDIILVCDQPVAAQRNRIVCRSNDTFESLGTLLSNRDRKVDQFIYLWDTVKNTSHQSSVDDVADNAKVLLDVAFNLNRVFAKTSYAQSQIFLTVSGPSNSAYESTFGNIVSGTIAGYLKSLSTEYPKLSGRIIAMPRDLVMETPSIFYRELIDVYAGSKGDGKSRENNQWVKYALEDKKTTRYTKQMSLLDFNAQNSNVSNPNELSHNTSGSNTASSNKRDALSGIRHKGCYLISGGMGGIGKILSRYLSEKYSATLILLGRSELNEALASHLALLNESGGKAFYFDVDISDRAALTQRMDTIRATCGRIDGVIHAAGKIEDNFLLSKSAASFESVLRPKISGTVNLDLETRDDPLDFFMGFSSLTSVFGNVGQCDYGAANGFLDAYMAYRSQCKLAPGMSLGINWPLWLDGGMGVSSDQTDIEEGLDERFGSPIGLDVGIKCFEDSLFLGRPQVIVIQEKFAVKKPEISAPKIQEKYEIATAKNSRAAFKTQSALINDADIETYLYEDVRELIAKKGKFDPQRIRPSDNFIALGLESVFLTSLSGQINKKYGAKLSPATFFEYSRLDSLVNYILEDYREEIHAFYREHTSNSSPVASQAPTVEIKNGDHNGEVPTGSPINPSFRRGLHRAVSNGTDQHSSGQKYQGKYAIVGMDCLFPGAPDLESFWDVLESGKYMISEVPRDRWDWQSIYGDPAQETNKTNIKWGGFVEDLDKFDPEFFNISPREAALMDPQQRIVLQSVWKAIEHAGYAPLSLSDTHKVGLFLGASTNDYFELLAKRDVEAYSSTGGVHSITANRVSYLLDFKGPSIPVDTACSSSLVALDMAVKSLEDGQCDVAIVGGVNALITPTLYLAFSKAGMLSPTGIISPLDKAANGYVRGEGVGVLVLKKLDRAIKDNDTVHAVVRGTAVNHGGRVSSLTVPNPNAQAELILDACDKAEIDVTTLSFIEMHGTGTPLGDPVEVNGLKKAFKQGEAVKGTGYCGISSVKANLGHLEAAAGIAGVIKAVLSLQHQTVCAQGNFHELNPHIQLDNSPFRVIERTAKWVPIKNEQGNGLPRRAGVSSFGFGGANAHTILEEYIAEESVGNASPVDGRSVNKISTYADILEAFVLSAKTDKSLQRIALKLKDTLVGMKRHSKMEDGEEREQLNNIAFTLQTGRSPMVCRLAVQAQTMDELIDKLSAYLTVSESASGSLTQESIQDHAIFIGDCHDVAEFSYRYEKSKGLAACLAKWVAGADIDWLSYYPSGSCKHVPLPTYEFSRERYWLSLDVGRDESTDALTKNAPSQEPLKDFCIHFLTSIAATVLQTSPSKIKRKTPLDQYGMDSMMVIQVVNTLKKDFKDIDSVVLMRYRTIEALAEYFIKEYTKVITGLYEDGEQYKVISKAIPEPDNTQQNMQVNDAINVNSPVSEVSGIAQDLADGKFDFKDAIKKIRAATESDVSVVNGDKEASRETV
ncbi:MAG: SDR family NAD(P)-dependent oxidoreductase [Agarilytica sp.]